MNPRSRQAILLGAHAQRGRMGHGPEEAKGGASPHRGVDQAGRELASDAREAHADAGGVVVGGGRGGAESRNLAGV